MLKLGARVQRVLANARRKRIANLVAVKMRSLRKIEVRAIRQVGKDQLIGQV